MFKYLLISFVILTSDLISNSNLWIGNWVAMDEWQSEYEIILH